MKKKKLIVFGIGVFVLIGIGTINKSLSAQLSFLMTPLVQDIKMRPGETKNLGFTIFTWSGAFQTVKFRLYLLDFNLTREGKVQFFPPGTLKRSCSLWCKIDYPEIAIRSGEKKRITVTIKAPGEVYGGYYAALILENISDSMERSNGLTPKTWRIVSFLKITIEGELSLQRRANISEIKVKQNSSDKNLIFTVTLENEGDIHLKAEGELYIENTKGDVLAMLPLKAGGGTVLPDSCRDFIAEYNEGLFTGDYVVRVVVKYGNSESERAVAELRFSVLKK